MKRIWIAAALLMALLVGTVAMAEARGPRGAGPGEGARADCPMATENDGVCPMRESGMMGQGMMGKGKMGQGMMGRGQTPQMDLAAMLARHQEVLTELQARLAAATDEQVKATLARQIERHQLMVERMTEMHGTGN